MPAAMSCSTLACTYPCCIGQLRYVTAAMSFLSVIVTHCQRMAFNVAIVEMVEMTTATKATCPLPAGQGAQTIAEIKGGKIKWPENAQNWNLSSFYIGFFITHVPSGILADRYGARHVLIAGILISTVCTALIPPAAIYMEWWSVCVLRILIGVGQGVQYPCLSSLMGRWIPANERTTIGAVVFAANSLGYVAGQLGTGLLIKYTEDWTIAYYVWGGVGVVFVLLAYLYVYSDPRTHPHATLLERAYLQEMIVPQHPMKIPVWKMCTDLCVQGLIVGQIGHDSLTFLLANNLPKYLNNVLGFDIESNALFSFIYIFQWLTGFLFGIVADQVIKHNANITLMRKLYSVVSIILSSLCMVGVGFVECRTVYVVCLLMTTTFWNGLYYCGMKVQIFDISVNQTGLLMAVINGAGSLSGFFASSLVGVIVHNNTHSEWQHVFVIMFIIHVLCAILYGVMTTSKRRRWDYAPDEKPEEVHRARKWYLELSPSEHAARVEKERRAKYEHEMAMERVKASMRQTYIAMRASGSFIGHRALV